MADMVTLRRLALYLKPYPWLLMRLFVAMLIGIGAELLLPRLLGLVVDRGISTGQMSAVFLYTGLMVAVGLARAGAHYMRGWSQERVGQEVVRRLRHELFTRLQRLSFGYYTVHATGDQMSRLTSDVYSIMDFFGFGLAEMISAVLMFVGTIVVLLVTDWHLALAVSAPIPVLMFFAFRFSGIVGPMWERIREEMGKLTATLQENVSGIRVVKSYSREHHEIGKFRDRNATNLSANLDRANVEATTFPLLTFITGFCFVILYWYGGDRVFKGQMTLGTFVSFNWYL
jgi:ATP-binding cassette subfamily B multidrug efflux pump